MSEKREAVTVVSGLPRSGTSMMMQMLHAAGLSTLTDGVRGADRSNPRGYYEFERAKRLKEDNSWLGEARGCAVKIVSPLLYHLPPGYRYQVIFMERAMDEILASQKAMLAGLEETDSAEVDDAVMGRRFDQHLSTVSKWLSGQAHIDVLRVSYNDLLRSPYEHVDRVCVFLNQDLDRRRMLAVLDPELYRQRSQTQSQ